MNKNSKRKLKHLFFLFSIMSLSLGLSVKTMEVHAESIENNIIETDVVSSINLDKDFDDSSVIVVLDKENSGINKIHKPEEFGLDDNYIIEDLTYLKWDISEYKYLNRENFKQILQIKLPISSKENVVETIGMLSTINGLISVEPNYLETQESVLPDNFASENYSELWGLHGENGIKADMAWRYSTGSQTVKVGVIDGGIANHPDLNANVIC